MKGAEENPVMKTGLLLIRNPSPQFWLLRVRKEFHPFLQTAFNPLLFEKEPLFTTLSAQLFFVAGKKSAGPDILVKRIQAQKAADYVRRLIFCQGRREFFSSIALLQMGLKCPTPLGYAINLIPFSRYDSLLISEFLPDTVPVSQHIAAMSPSERLFCQKRVADDISLMLSHNVFHKDLQLNNILLKSSDGSQLYWIDNDLKNINKTRMQKHPNNFLAEITRNIQFCSEEEKFLFMKELFSGLKKHGNGNE